MALSEALRSEIQSLATDGLTIFRGVLVRLDKFVTGDTLRSLSVRTEFKSSTVLISYYAVDTFEFRLGQRGPGLPPPIDPLQDWIDAKGLDINPYALQNHIAEFGTVTKPVPFFEEVGKELAPKILAVLESDEIGLILLRDMDNLFNNRRR